MPGVDGIRENSWKTYAVIFMIYSTLGCIGEHLAYFVSSKNKRVENPIMAGFPIYGIGAYVIILSIRALKTIFPSANGKSILDNIVFQFLFSAIILTMMEYAAGRLIGAGGLNGDGTVNAWDYTGTFMNYRGIINLQHFLLHGILGIIVLKIHPYIVERVNRMWE